MSINMVWILVGIFPPTILAMFILAGAAKLRKMTGAKQKTVEKLLHVFSLCQFAWIIVLVQIEAPVEAYCSLVIAGMANEICMFLLPANDK